MILEIIFIIIIIFVYINIYYIFKINKNNNLYLFEEELSRKNIQSEISLKLPFFFNGKHINDNIDLKKLKIIEKNPSYKVYHKDYENITLLEPSFSFNASCKIYKIKPLKYLELQSYLQNYNFFIVKKGKCKITLIHPKYKDNFIKNNKLISNKENIDFLKNNDHYKFLECYKDTIIYIPNFWISFIENIDEKNDLQIELLQYKTIFNEVLFLKEKLFNK